jgi:hypothetical protein
LLSKWRAAQREGGPQVFVGSGQQSEAEAELRRLRRENDVLRQERDILKKRWWSSAGTGNEVCVHRGAQLECPPMGGVTERYRTAAQSAQD